MAYLSPMINTETNSSTFYLLFEDSTTGPMIPRTDSGLTFTPTANLLGVGGITVTNTSTVVNLNADMLDGQHSSYFAISTHNHNGTYAPVSHIHGNLTDDGKLGTNIGNIAITTTGGLLTAMPQGTTSQYLRGDGTWATPPDNNTTYTAGNGLGLSGTTFSLDTPGTLSASSTNAVTADSHTHAITTSSSGAVSTIVATDAGGNISIGNVTAASLNKSGGTSSQFLKADGSVDSNTYVTSAAIGNGTLSMGVSGTGLTGSATFYANNGAGTTTFTVTSNADASNGASTIVARDASGNFAANTITANLTGTASLATNAAQWGGLSLPSIATNAGKVLTVNPTNSGVIWSESTYESMVRKNWLINGMFDVWQRGTSQTVSGYGSDDRWINNMITSTKTHSRQSFAVGQTDVPNNPSYFSRTVVVSGGTSGSYTLKGQAIEDVTKLAGKTITLSFWAKADSNKNMSIDFSQVFGTGGSGSVVSIGVQKFVLTSSWQRFTKTVAIPSISGKTIGTSNYLGLNFWFDAGSDFNARTDSLGNQSGTFDIANVCLVEGSTPVECPKETYAEVLSKCQRYYDYGTIVSQTFLNNVNSSASDFLVATGFFNQEMRVVPTMSFTSNNGGTITNYNMTTTKKFVVKRQTNFLSPLSVNYTADAEL